MTGEAKSDRSRGILGRSVSVDRPLFLALHFTSCVCFCVGYKMKTCTQISHSGFRGKINAGNPCDLAKRASPGRSASPCKREVESSPHTRAGPPPYKHLQRLYEICYFWRQKHGLRQLVLSC